MNGLKNVLLYRLNTLCSAVPSTDIRGTILRGFEGMAPREGYELLRFLVVACGISVEGDPSLLKAIGGACWKNLHPDTKATIERFKTDILQAVKDLLQTNHYDFKPLRKSDLMTSLCIKYFSCCLYLSEIAINHQLENSGIIISSNISNDQCSIEFIQASDSFKEQEYQFENEGQIIHLKTEEYLNDTVSIISQINHFKKIKNEINPLIQEIINRCPLVYRDSLKDPFTLHDAMASWSKYLSELHSSNDTKVSKIVELDRNLSILCSLIDNGFKQSSVDGNTYVSLLSNELILFSCEKEVDLVEENSLNLLALLKILLRSIPREAIDIVHLEKLRILECPKQNAALFEKLTAMEKELEQRISEKKASFGKKHMDLMRAIKDVLLKEIFI